VSVRSRVVFASGAAGAVGAALLLTARFEGSVVLALVLVLAIRTASLGALVGGGPILAAGALRGLGARGWVAAAWTLIVAAAVLRAGSTALTDIRGANAVAGVALGAGPALTVAGSWLAFVAAVLSLTTRTSLGIETGGPAGSIALVRPPSGIVRLDSLGVLAEASLAAALFLGPQVVDGVDAVWWAIPIAGLVAVVALVRRGSLRIPRLRSYVPAALAAAGLFLVVLGGAP
jgi:hypothetical protein